MRGWIRKLTSWRPSAPTAAAMIAVAVAIGFGGALFYKANAPVPPDVREGGASRYGWMIELEVAGSPQAALTALGLDENATDEDVDRAVVLARRALGVDRFLIGSYVIAIVVAGFLGSVVFIAAAGRTVGSGAAWAGVLAGGFDAIENLSLGHGLTTLEPSGGAAGPFVVAAIAASLKFALLTVALPVALFAAGAIVKRAVARWRSPPRSAKVRGTIYVPAPVLGTHGHRWPAAASGVVEPPGRTAEKLDPRRAHHRYERMIPHTRQPAQSGFCVSGGGIRSACVTLGALQSLRDRLLRARYLVSVSGGGYMAGAMQLTLAPKPKPRAASSASSDDAGASTASSDDVGASTATPQDVYDSGSVEEGHTRRHGNYIADGAKEWTAALVAILRGVVASFIVLGSGIVTLGLACSFAYEAVPLFGDPEGLADMANSFIAGPEAGPPAFPTPTGYSGWTVAGGAAAAVVFWFVSVALLDAPSSGDTRKAFVTVARGSDAVTTTLGVLVLVIPTIAWGAAYLAWWTEGEGVGRDAVQSSVLTFVATYFGTLVSILWRQRKKVEEVQKQAKGLLGKKGQATGGRTSGGFVQRVIVWAALGVLLVFALTAFGATVATGARWGPWAFLPVGILVVVQAFVDQTWMSLHPFYRRRLASAFSVRREHLPKGDVGARPYDFEEGTPLDDYGARHEPFPQIVFACAANLSGSDRTPPGRRAVSYTMSHDYIGGPDVGYVPTKDVLKLLSGPLKADLTVQAAMAVSGAAFASAMGRQATAFQTLLAISNARLGTWLPNPVYLNEAAAEGAPWWLPDLPRIRRLTYFLREIVGHFPQDDRLLLVTDGGHYENLGLVELLRHRVRVAYCIDASGDSPPFPETLCEAITLAKEELGIEIELDMLDLMPGSADPVGPGDVLNSLNARMSKTCAVMGKITYPEPFKLSHEAVESDQGLLVFAKALLTPNMPSDLLAYAQADSAFPRDSTGDQWFSHEQFDAYVELGRHVGRQVTRVARERDPLASPLLSLNAPRE